MPRQDGRIEPGQKISSAISARAWNRAQDAADIVLGSRYGVAAEPGIGFAAPYTWVYAKNTTGSDLARWGVMKISGVEVTPTATDADRATAQFCEMPIIIGVGMSSTDPGANAACVAIEPIKNDKIGRVAVAGVVQAKTVDVGKVFGATTLWKNSDWSLIRIGGGTILGKTTAAWSKGSLATIDIYGSGTPPSETKGGSDPTLADCVNKFADVGSGKWVMVAQAGNGSWYLIAAECG